MSNFIVPNPFFAVIEKFSIIGAYVMITEIGVIMEKGKRSVVIVSMITALCLLGDSMLYVVLPMYWQEVGLTSLWEVGVVLSMNRLVRLPLNPVVGWVYQRVTVKTALSVAVLLGIATTVGYAVASTFAVWVAVRALWGISWTFLRLGGYYVVLECSPEKNRGQYMGLYNGLHRLGHLGGALLGGILAEVLGYHMMAVVFGILTVGAIIPLGMLKNVPIEGLAEERGSVQLPRSIWLKSSFLWLMATGFVVTMLYYGMLSTILSPLVHLHTDPIVLGAGAVIGATALSGILQAIRWAWEPWGAPWVGKVSDRFGDRSRMLAASFAVTAVLVGMMTLDVPMLAWILIVLGVQMGGTCLTTLADSAAADRSAAIGRMSVMTWFAFAFDVGAAIGPLVAFFLVAHAGLHSVCWVGAISLMIFAVYWSRRKGNIAQ